MNPYRSEESHSIMRRVLLVSALFLVLAAAFVFRPGLSSIPSPQAKRETVMPVTVAPASIDVVYDRIEALGTAYSNESATITSTVTDKVVAVHFEDGQPVRRGEPIVTLAQQEELAARAAAVEQLAEHQRELKRLESLLENRSIARQQVDQRRTLLRITEQRIRELEARIQDHTIRAPFDGVLGLRKISVGALIEPGDVITTIDDVSRIKLDFPVPETYIGELSPGAAVSAASRSLGGRTFQGAVASIGTRVDPATRSFVVRAILPNPDRALRPGMLLTVSLIKNERRSLVIPEDALVPLQRRNFVWVVDPAKGGTVERREVEIGTRRPGEVEIRIGLAENELVIVRGTELVRPGSRVQITKTMRSPSAGPGA
jgi:membrane fusion protein (multidrug efflux system)